MGGEKINKKLFQDRQRTNILSDPEQRLITYLVPKVPRFITSNGLTTIGTLGSVLIFVSFILAKYIAVPYLLLGILGFAINWFGDSLDGRIAYYRNTPRKWYGFSLDIIMDWVSTVLIGAGYLVYCDGYFEIFAYIFVVLYGWAMIISQLRYKITDKYSIDAGLVGPTEIRVIISLIFVAEVIYPSLINYLVIVICIILFIINMKDTNKLLEFGDARDKAEKEEKAKAERENNNTSL